MQDGAQTRRNVESITRSNAKTEAVVLRAAAECGLLAGEAGGGFNATGGRGGSTTSETFNAGIGGMAGGRAGGMMSCKSPPA